MEVNPAYEEALAAYAEANAAYAETLAAYVEANATYAAAYPDYAAAKDANAAAEAANAAAYDAKEAAFDAFDAAAKAKDTIMDTPREKVEFISCDRCDAQVKTVNGNSTQPDNGWDIRIEDGYGMYTDLADEALLQNVMRVILCKTCCDDFVLGGTPAFAERFGK